MDAGTEPPTAPNSWRNKFRVAIKACVWAFVSQNSFLVHFTVTVAVLVTATVLQIEAWRWAVLLLAIGGVLAAEMFNTSIEILVKVLHPDQDPQIGVALDVAAGAVLITAISSVAIGIVAIGPPLWEAAFAP